MTLNFLLFPWQQNIYLISKNWGKPTRARSCSKKKMEDILVDIIHVKLPLLTSYVNRIVNKELPSQSRLFIINKLIEELDELIQKLTHEKCVNGEDFDNLKEALQIVKEIALEFAKKVDCARNESTEENSVLDRAEKIAEHFFSLSHQIQHIFDLHNK
jgi:hypothetical protein